MAIHVQFPTVPAAPKFKQGDLVREVKVPSNIYLLGGADHTGKKHSWVLLHGHATGNFPAIGGRHHFDFNDGNFEYFDGKITLENAK